MSIQDTRDNLLIPVSRFATRYRITPTMISIAGIVSMAIFGVTTYTHLYIASLVFLALSILADLLDGSLARYQKKETDRGRMVDIITDNIVFDIFMIALGLSQLISLSVAIIIIVLQIIVTRKNTRKAVASIQRTGLQVHELHGFWILPNILKAIMYISFIIGIFSTTEAVPIMR